MSTKTGNYELTLWAGSDSVNVDEINANFSAVDTAIAAAASAAAGNVMLQTGSYVGTGVYGINNKSTLTFAHKPLCVFIFGQDSGARLDLSNFPNGPQYAYARYGSDGYGVNNVTWSADGKTATWYCQSGGSALQGGSSYASDIGQMNDSEKNYFYFYIYQTEESA